MEKHSINKHSSVREALVKLNLLGADAILFVIDDDLKLLGSLTDGDLRRGFIKGLTMDHKLTDFIQSNPFYIYQDEYHLANIEKFREQNLKVIPVVDRNKIIVSVINTRFIKSIISTDVVILAGGKGERLMPLTKDTPKPMLIVGDKPIIEHNIDYLIKYGIQHIQVSVNYLSEVIKDYLGDGSSKKIEIEYIEEMIPMGTIGSITLAKKFHHDIVLVMNSDLLTNIDFSEFYQEFIAKGADMAVACIPYNVNIPYAIMDTDHENILGLKEKPTFTYYSNAGIYLIKREHLEKIPRESFYNATDLIENLIDSKHKVIYYPLLGYWLDIGKMDDFKKAQEDIKHIKF